MRSPEPAQEHLYLPLLWNALSNSQAEISQLKRFGSDFLDQEILSVRRH